jgi:hypothetical protein
MSRGCPAAHMYEHVMRLPTYKVPPFDLFLAAEWNRDLDFNQAAAGQSADALHVF